MCKERLKKQLKNYLQSEKALVIPLTYLILFASLIIVISVTYSLAVAKISARGALLKASVAKHNMQVLDDAVMSVAWSFGASRVVYMDDCGDVFRTSPAVRNLSINFTDEESFYDLVFDSFVGKSFYEIRFSEFNYENFFMIGDGGAITNSSPHTMTQLGITTDDNGKELVLCYRPSATSIVINSSNIKPQNYLRVNIINLNSSRNLTLREMFYLKVTSEKVTTVTRQYEFNESISSLALKVALGETQTTVWLPITSNAEGASVYLETVVCYIKLQKTQV